eukprot:gene13417-15809_t
MVAQLDIEKHIKYLKRSLNALPSPYKSAMPNHLSVVYFTVSAFDVLNRLEELDPIKQDIIDFVYSRQVRPNPGDTTQNCGFRGANFLGQEYEAKYERCSCSSHPVMEFDLPSLANTYCALMILRIMGDDYSRVNKDGIVVAMRKLQQTDGSFNGQPGVAESDLRHLFCATAISFMLDDWRGMDRELALRYVMSSVSYERGIGQGPGQEAHGGSTYCGLATLALLGKIDQLEDREGLIGWLTARQITGFNGRTNKDPDTCYTFWVGASLAILKATALVNFDLVRAFVFEAQHSAIGGIAKQPDTLPDALHTYMAIQGLAIGGQDNLAPVNYVLGITQRAAGDDWNSRLLK